MSRTLVSCLGALVACGVLMTSGAEAQAQSFTYNPAGELVAGSGTGRADSVVYVPGMRFPIEAAPAYPNSQVYGHGGYKGPGGGQCNEANYSYPWVDNYCESRSWSMALCPSGKGHQGQDIRPATCKKDLHWVVSAQAGKVTKIGTYSVYIVADDGTRHRYLHMSPKTLQVKVGDRVEQGARIGRVSNAFGDSATTIHLHYDIYRNVAGVGQTYVPTYMSLVRSYETLLGINQPEPTPPTPSKPCGVIRTGGGILDNANPCFELLGNRSYWRTATGETSGYANGHNWTYAFDGANPGSWAKWTLQFKQSGTYDVQVYTEEGPGQSARARFEVAHEDQTSPVTLDMGAASGWRSIGQWWFEEGMPQHVALYDNTGEPSASKLRIKADAIRVVRVERGPYIDGIDLVEVGTEDDKADDLGGLNSQDPSTEDDGGCSTTPAAPTGAHWVWLGVLGLVGLRRRRPGRGQTP